MATSVWLVRAKTIFLLPNVFFQFLFRAYYFRRVLRTNDDALEQERRKCFSYFFSAQPSSLFHSSILSLSLPSHGRASCKWAMPIVRNNYIRFPCTQLVRSRYVQTYIYHTFHYTFTDCRSYVLSSHSLSI